MVVMFAPPPRSVSSRPLLQFLEALPVEEGYRQQSFSLMNGVPPVGCRNTMM